MVSFPVDGGCCSHSQAYPMANVGNIQRLISLLIQLRTEVSSLSSYWVFSPSCWMRLRIAWRKWKAQPLRTASSETLCSSQLIVNEKLVLCTCIDKSGHHSITYCHKQRSYVDWVLFGKSAHRGMTNYRIGAHRHASTPNSTTSTRQNRGRGMKV